MTIGLKSAIWRTYHFSYSLFEGVTPYKYFIMDWEVRHCARVLNLGMEEVVDFSQDPLDGCIIFSKAL